VGIAVQVIDVLVGLRELTVGPDRGVGEAEAGILRVAGGVSETVRAASLNESSLVLLVSVDEDPGLDEVLVENLAEVVDPLDGRVVGIERALSAAAGVEVRRIVDAGTAESNVRNPVRIRGNSVGNVTPVLDRVSAVESSGSTLTGWWAMSNIASLMSVGGMLVVALMVRI
jgi:hypothetical protein